MCVLTLCEGAYDLKICEISFAIPGLKISLAPKTQVIEKRINDVMTYRIPADMTSKMLISTTLRNHDTEKVTTSYVFLFSGGGGVILNDFQNILFCVPLKKKII